MRTRRRVQWRTQYPLPERTVRVLRPVRLLSAVGFLLETTLFALTLTEEEPSTSTLTWTGIGAVYFPLLFLLAHRMPRKDSRARASREG